jgi:hypothetical protein
MAYVRSTDHVFLTKYSHFYIVVYLTRIMDECKDHK